MEYLVFKSDPEYFSKEKYGSKPNTIRKVDEDDERYNILKTIMKKGRYGKKGSLYKIHIENNETGEKFARYITDISVWDGYFIISWHPVFRPPRGESKYDT